VWFCNANNDTIRVLDMKKQFANSIRDETQQQQAFVGSRFRLTQPTILSFAVLFDGDGEPEQLLKVPLPELGEGFRVRATKVRCSLPTRTTGILVSINLRLI
jgi:hypothetical protein